MRDPRLAFIYPPEIERLKYPDDCPFKTHRVTLVRQKLRSFGCLGGARCREVAAPPATREELTAFHAADYLDELERAAGGELTERGLRYGLGTPDTPVFPDLYEYGRRAAGAGLRAAEVILAGEAEVVFDLVGGFHHAHAARASGFCYVNDVVLACRRLAAAGRRVFCLDLDAHHGDGTQAAFYERNDVFTVSLHESGKTLFPWGGFEHEVGEGAGAGCNANLSLPAGIYDAAFLRALDEFAFPLLDAWSPDVVVVELGMDTLAGDPLTHLALTNNVYPDLAERLLARERPLLILGGGGYHVDNTVRAWTLMWRALAGEEVAEDLNAGMGGVFLGSTDWIGGLRDAPAPPSPEQARNVDAALDQALTAARTALAPWHPRAFPACAACAGPSS